MERIRTLSEIPLQVNFHHAVKQPLYQENSVTTLHLKQLTLNPSTIARRLCVGTKPLSKLLGGSKILSLNPSSQYAMTKKSEQTVR